MGQALESVRVSAEPFPANRFPVNARDELAHRGYALVPAVLEVASLEGLRSRLDEQAAAEVAAGQAWPEPPNGQRVWMLLNKGAVFVQLVTHELALAASRTVLGPAALLSNITANIVGAGAPAQALHTDQGFLPGSVREPMVLTAIWFLDDFTVVNGATRVIPGSHRVEEGASLSEDTAAVTGPAGSLLLLDGRLRHGAGSSLAAAPSRRAVIVNYCSPVLRQQENFWRSLDRAVFERADRNLLRLLGDDVFDSLGMVNGLSPGWRSRAAADFGPSWR